MATPIGARGVTKVVPMFRLLKVKGSVAVLSRHLHQTSSLQRIRGRRAGGDLPERWNATRIFADTPDWSFNDGRPTPLNTNQKKRYLQQIENCETIVKYLKQLEGAKAAEAGKIQEAKEMKERIMSGKFTPKGVQELQMNHDRWSKRSI